MTKILVLSDSHGNVGNMVRAVKREEPDLVIHLGDCVVDAQELQKECPRNTIVGVPGNCDYSMDDTERVLTIDGFRILICHGHTYGVKMSYLSLELHAKEVEADIALFGHTHKIFYDHNNGVAMLNPGSIGSPLWGSLPSYGILELDEEKHTFSMDIDYIEY